MTSESDLAPTTTSQSGARLGLGGLNTWARITALVGLDNRGAEPRALFVPSDAAFGMLPSEVLCKLLSHTEGDFRRAFLARAATDASISLESLSGRRILITTLDGRPLAIDATGGELMVGEAEVLDVRTLPNGTVIFILDDAALN
jgi:uncharacterized surface protein with fasciclin (FAS1) repeats